MEELTTELIEVENQSLQVLSYSAALQTVAVAVLIMILAILVIDQVLGRIM